MKQQEHSESHQFLNSLGFQEFKNFFNIEIMWAFDKLGS